MNLIVKIILWIFVIQLNLIVLKLGEYVNWHWFIIVMPGVFMIILIIKKCISVLKYRN